MQSQKYTLLSFFLAIGFCLIAFPAHATVTSVAPVPSSKNIAVSQSASFQVTWYVRRSNASGVGVQVTSLSGQFRGNGDPDNPLQNVFLVLSQTKPITGISTSFKFSENVRLSAQLIQNAKASGFSFITYRRWFDDGGGGNFASVTFRITGSSATGFTVSRQAMRFDDNSIVKLLNEKDALKAKADVNYNGSGQLEAFWEVAGPSTAGGVPIFRTLRSVRKYLMSGGDKTTLVSPLLPSTTAGAYMVRMRITSPVPGFESPIIRYFVGSKGAQIAPPLPMRVGSPVDRVWFNENTRFKWEAVKGAAHYRLEIYNKPQETDIASALPNLGDDQTSKKPIRLQGGPVAGMMLSSDTLQTALSASVQSHLLGGRWYYWRIVAIGKGGKIVGLSPIREMRMP
ncbi:MAG: hypothetical protein BMS9Abin11_1428 [Gammaproteobacteria bacterium]|nr:MAG: hypothetical protein BMS9Abin11_1428 [Gammaproteobacteria bacterium]